MAERVKDLRHKDRLSLKKISRETKLPIRKVKYILYEHDVPRVQALAHDRMEEFKIRAESRSIGTQST